MRVVCTIPAGTTTNQRSVIAFKRGAFAPGVPVQPVAVRIPFQHMDPAWVAGGPSLTILLLRLMLQFNNNVRLIPSTAALLQFTNPTPLRL